MAQVGDHAARNLVDVLRVIVLRCLANGEIFDFRASGQELARVPQRRFIDDGFVAQCAGVHRDGEDGRIARPIGERRHRRVDVNHARFDRFKTTERAQSCGAVGVQLHGFAASGFKYGGHRGSGALRSQDATGIFEDHPVDVQREGLADFCRVVFVGVARRDRVDEIDDRLQAGLLRLLDPPSPVIGIIPRVRDAHFFDADVGHASIEELVQCVRIDGKAAARAMDEPQWSFFELGNDQAVALPGIFAQLFHAFGQFNRAAELDGFEARCVELFANWRDHAGADIVSPKALRAVAYGGVDKFNFGHGSLLL